MTERYYCPFSMKTSAGDSMQILCPAKDEKTSWKCPLATEEKECAFKILADAARDKK